jgi:hypothetical protein
MKKALSRFTEIGELGVAVIAFSYAAWKYHDLVHADDHGL